MGLGPKMETQNEPLSRKVPGLHDDFLERLEASLEHAEQERRRHNALERARPLLPLGLPVGSLVAWKLLFVSGASAHVVISALAWLTFVLDVGVHLNTGVLAYLNLQALPSVVGLLLLVLVTVGLLTGEGEGP